ncbi:hypothetical protein, partial [Rhodanobacter terrae]
RHGVHLIRFLLVKKPAGRLGYPGQFSVGISSKSGSVLDRPQHRKKGERLEVARCAGHQSCNTPMTERRRNSAQVD